MLMSLAQPLLLAPFGIGIAESLFNHLINRSAQTLPILRKLDGKILHISLKQPNLPFFILFSPTRTDWLSQYDGEPDCTVQLEATALPKLADKARLSELINQKTVQLTGDLQVLQHFSMLLDELEKQPAELLSHIIGDVPAQISTDLVGKIWGKIHSQFRQDSQHLIENLMVERPVLVHRLEAQDFYDQIDELARQAVRLEQKFATLGME
ncbi:ubiquinone biosynthesis accessory factor UbiJ [Muribacter muris]